MHPDVKRLLAEYPTQINYVVRHMPADAHPFALLSAQAAECARDEGKFMEYHNLMLDNGVSGPEDLTWYADQLGLSADFIACLNSGQKFGIIQQHVLEASTHNIRGTPTIFLNGRKMEGQQNYVTLQPFVEAILSNG